VLRHKISTQTRFHNRRIKLRQTRHRLAICFRWWCASPTQSHFHSEWRPPRGRKVPAFGVGPGRDVTRDRGWTWSVLLGLSNVCDGPRKSGGVGVVLSRGLGHSSPSVMWARVDQTRCLRARHLDSIYFVCRIR
jgi:hypothetical protein